MSGRRVLTLVICVLTALVVAQQGDRMTCGAPWVAPVRVSINSRRHLTGHWTSKVGLEYRGPESHRGTTVDVDHSIAPCVSTDPALNILITFTASMETTNAVVNLTNGFQLYPGVGIYKYHNNYANWTQAQEICAEEDAHLAIINSEKESSLFVDLYKSYKGQQPWVGLQRIGDEYFTIQGNHLNTTGFTRWSPSEPDKGNSYCIYMNSVNGGLADSACNSKMAFICEK